MTHPDEPMFPLPRMDHELRHGLAVEEDWHEYHDGYGCAVLIGCVAIFWAAVIAAILITVS